MARALLTEAGLPTASVTCWWTSATWLIPPRTIPAERTNERAWNYVAVDTLLQTLAARR